MLTVYLTPQPSLEAQRLSAHGALSGAVCWCRSERW